MSAPSTVAPATRNRAGRRGLRFAVVGMANSLSFRLSVGTPARPRKCRRDLPCRARRVVRRPRIRAAARSGPDARARHDHPDGDTRSCSFSHRSCSRSHGRSADPTSSAWRCSRAGWRSPLPPSCWEGRTSASSSVTVPAATARAVDVRPRAMYRCHPRKQRRRTHGGRGERVPPRTTAGASTNTGRAVPRGTRTYVQRQPDPGTTVVHSRLGLTILDPLDKPDGPAPRRIAEELHRRAITSTDDYAARECLADSRFTDLVKPTEAQAARELVRACALGSGDLSAPRSARLFRALLLSDEVIPESVARPRIWRESDSGVTPGPVPGVGASGRCRGALRR